MKKNIHIHLDPIGGISGDMFISSMIDANPKLKKITLEISKNIIKGIKLSIKKAKNGHISGTSVLVQNTNKEKHHHRAYYDVKKIINDSFLNNTTKLTAIELFKRLATAESKIHGISLFNVKFHEIGAWDSIIDNIIAAEIIEYYRNKYNVTWSCSPLPIGKGKVSTAHGILSIPAPATSLLLKNFPIIEDGVEGERTTPTGAAIINLIDPHPDIASATNEALKIKYQGIGIGSKNIKNIPNILRTLIFTNDKSPIKNVKREIVNKISFDIDDQSPEDLSLSLDRIKKVDGVIDISQTPTIGKKGRLLINIKILCRVEKANKIISCVFNETSTIGLRTSIIARQTLDREIKRISNFSIKEVKRPSGISSKKVESKDLKNYSYKNRSKIRNKIEQEIAIQ